MSSVYQGWFHHIPWKMQSIASNGLRAPDTKTGPTKKAVRWMRTQLCNNADPHKADCYMTAAPPDMEMVVQAGKELEYLPCHYVHHFADAMRVVSLYHPNPVTRYWAYQFHYHIAEEVFHFVPETDVQFVYRHRDKVETGSTAIFFPDSKTLVAYERLQQPLPPYNRQNGPFER
jgi:hypothetical protein